MSDGLTLSVGTVHMVIDMQRIFSEDTEWRYADMASITPQIVKLATAFDGRNCFTRFLTPHVASHAKGRWQYYYERWQQFTGRVMAPELIEVIEDLAGFATPDTLIDKTTYSAFEVPACEARLQSLDAHTIVFSGIETDVCVLATLMAAVDRGYRVIAVADALGSSSTAGHRATLDHVLPRMPEQIEIVDTRTVLRAMDPRNA